ncbi:hypothetical protein Javan513_0036 [Streptococcus phage Javan513]|nr:hypothetical protein HMPREF1244_1619 [Streptococcus pyogenes GA19702]QBX20273.1 hypothetical protein Javan513_0036 [Streptococcus phage Javan513]SDV81174.1 hypothetical protein ISR5_0274 [Streptococcus pyogenes]
MELEFGNPRKKLPSYRFFQTLKIKNLKIIFKKPKPNWKNR